MKKCDSGRAWDDGGCCCNCKHQIRLNCHPWNKEFGKGSISEKCGTVCMAMLNCGEPGSGDFNAGIFSDNDHGYCELWTDKEAT